MMRPLIRIGLWLAALVLAAGLAWLALSRPLPSAGLRSHPRPAGSYDEALRVVDSLRGTEAHGLSPECGTELLTHGGRAARAVVLLHGLTNCPAQFDSLARILFAGGANVLVPRLPRHGRADRMTTDLARLDPRELCAITDRAVDAACGLGDSVTVAGLSMGGVLAAWAGQERADVDRAVAIAPMIGSALAPGAARTAALARLGSSLPNIFIWWDDAAEQNLAGPKYVYPRFATRAVASLLLVGGAAMDRARHAAPAARSLAVITVGGDHAADSTSAVDLVQAWRAHGARVDTYEFPFELHLNHDVVDPRQVGQTRGSPIPYWCAGLRPERPVAAVRPAGCPDGQPAAGSGILPGLAYPYPGGALGTIRQSVTLPGRGPDAGERRRGGESPR